MISSILTNYGSMSALESLQATQSSLLKTQNHVSSGLRVATAKDDAANWVTSTTMRSNIASLQQVSQNLGNANSMLGTAVVRRDQHRRPGRADPRQGRLGQRSFHQRRGDPG